MTYNTGNPIGSTDARDLSDNAENFDKAINSIESTWDDRLGVTRDTFEGALSKLSFYRVGTFAAGYTLTNMRQTLEYNGHEYSWAGSFPKVVAVGSTPATSGGIGAGAWVDRTDVTLAEWVNSFSRSDVSKINPEDIESDFSTATSIITQNEDNSSFEFVGGELSPKSGVDYTQGMLAGGTKYLTGVRSYGDHNIISGLRFNGKSLGINSGYSPSGYNVLFEGAKHLGPSSGTDRSTGYTVVNCSAVDGSGAAFTAQKCDMVLIHNNIATHHQGVGIGGENSMSTVSGNISYNAYDAPFDANSANYSTFTGNVGVNSSNGAALDAVGTKYAAISGNVLSGHAKRGVQVRRSPNSNDDATGVLVAANVLHNNTKADKTGNAEQAEVTFGLSGSSEAGSSSAAISNLLIVKDESATGFKRAFYCATGFDGVGILGNAISYESVVTDNVIGVVNGSSNTVISGNVNLNKTKRLVKILSRSNKLSFHGNSGIGIDPSSTAWPTEMLKEDGYHRYNIIRPLPLTDTPIAKINWAGSYSTAEIEVTISQDGDRGIVKKRFVLRGVSTQSTVNYTLPSDTGYSLGTQPPIITLDTSNNAYSYVYARVQGGATSNCAIHIKVICTDNISIDYMS